jgi:hypothetical protein
MLNLNTQAIRKQTTEMLETLQEKSKKLVVEVQGRVDVDELKSRIKSQSNDARKTIADALAKVREQIKK